MRVIPRKFVAMIVLLSCIWYPFGVTMAQVEPGEEDYRFKIGDTVYLTVPMRPSLNGELAINAGGAVELPLIGEVDVAGLTLEEMHTKIYQALRDLYPSLATTDVIIEPVLGYVVYVTGAVMEPGRYRFSGPPKVWEAIRKAGGPTGEAVLDMVRIVNEESDPSQSRVVDVLKALETGTVNGLPSLDKESTVVVPSGREAYVGSRGVNVIGAVTRPGFYRLQGDHHDVMSAILLAGGATERASLDGVKIFRENDEGSIVPQKVDLKKYIDTGNPELNPLLQAGDTVSIPESSSFAYQLKNNSITIVLAFIGTTATLLLVVDRIKNP